MAPGVSRKDPLRCCHPRLHVDGAPERSLCCGYWVFGSLRKRAKNNRDFAPQMPICFETEVTGAIFYRDVIGGEDAWPVI